MHLCLIKLLTISGDAKLKVSADSASSRCPLLSVCRRSISRCSSRWFCDPSKCEFTICAKHCHHIKSESLFRFVTGRQGSAHADDHTEAV